jgi:hypothetical protein
MQTLHRLRRFRDLRAVSPGAMPPADGVPSPALVAPDQEARPAFPNPSRPSLARLGSRPLSLSPSLELAPRAGRFREADRDSGRSGCACPESGTVCRIGFAARCSFGKPWPILLMVPHVAGSMIARLSAGLHVCPFAW